MGSLVLLSPANKRPIRRMIYVDNYGGFMAGEDQKWGRAHPQRLRRCLQLARMGKIVLAEPLPDFYLRRNALPHDLKLLKLVRSWLGPEGIVFCGHNVLYWLLFLRSFGLSNATSFQTFWAREPLNFTGRTCHPRFDGGRGRNKLAGANVAWRNSAGGRTSSAFIHRCLTGRNRSPVASRCDFRHVGVAASCCDTHQVLCRMPLDGVTGEECPAQMETWDELRTKKIGYDQLLRKYYAEAPVPWSS